MQRRTYLKAVIGAAAGLPAVQAAGTQRPIEIHVDLEVDPAKEKEMLHNFRTQFKPAAEKHQGYIDVQMLKLRKALMGSAPQGMNYRFVLRYQSEELRLKWVDSADHKRVWPTIENTLSSKNYTVLLFDLT